MPEFDYLDVEDARIAGSALVERVPASGAHSFEGRGPSLLRVRKPDGSDVGDWDIWNAWYRPATAGARSARLYNGGDEAWIYVMPARSATAGEEYSWLVVYLLQGPHLRLQTLRTSSSAWIRSLKYIQDGKLFPATTNTPEERRKGKRTQYDVMSADVKDSAKSLRKAMRKLRAFNGESPDDARVWLFEGAQPLAVSVLEKTGQFLQACKGAPTEYGEFDARADALTDGVQQLNAHLDGWRDETSADFGLRGALNFLAELERTVYGIRDLLRSEKAARSSPYRYVDYEILTTKIAEDIRAFQHAAREAAVHETVFGGLVENRIRDLVARWLAPFSLSEGSVAGFSRATQIDGVIWDHQIAPAVVEQGDVAVVPAATLGGLFELKASKSEDLATLAEKMESLQILATRLRAHEMKEPLVPVLGILVQHTKTYDEIRAETRNLVTCLLQRNDDDSLDVNHAGVVDVLRFIFEDVLPKMRSRLRA